MLQYVHQAAARFVLRSSAVFDAHNRIDLNDGLEIQPLLLSMLCIK